MDRDDEWTAANLFAGIEGFGMGLARAGVRTVASVEIDDSARGVIAHRFPNVHLFSDVKDVTANDLLHAGFNPERGILTAGFPCQDISLAGKRAGLAGSRSGLFWEIIRIAQDLKPRWFLLENVPGLLTSNGGRDMGTVVGALAELGYGVGWRVLDAQHFGVPQRRRRVFLAGCLGDVARAGEILLEPESSAGDLAPRRAAGTEAAGAPEDGAVQRGGPGLLAERGVVQGITSSLATGGADAQHAQAGWLIPVPEVAGTLTSRYHKGINTTLDDGAQVVYQKIIRSGARDAEGNLPAEVWAERDIAATRNCFDSSGEARTTELILEPAYYAMQPEPTTPEEKGGLKAREVAVAPSLTSTDLAKTTDRGLRIVQEWRVRRLTPMECERLQGFPDAHTEERWDFKKGKVVVQSDAARGKQLGNAVAVPVVEWIGRRIVANDR